MSNKHHVVDYNHLHVVVRFLHPGFQAAAPGYFRGRSGNVSRSEKADAESVVTNTQLDESEPTPDLPAFNHKTAPTYLRCNIADEGSSFVSVTFTPDQLVIPGHVVRVNVKLLCLTHDPRLRIASVSLRVVVPDNQVRSVEPQKLLIDEGVMAVRRTDRTNRNDTAGLVLGPARLGTGVTTDTAIDRAWDDAISFDIRGGVDHNNAVWSIKDNGAQGIRGNVEQLSFTLWEPPRQILCMCSVSAMMEGGSVPITRHVRSGARAWIRGIGAWRWFSFLQLFRPYG